MHQNKYKLHAIILSRSPFLAHLMSTSPQSGGQRTIHVHLEHEPEVTEEVCARFPMSLNTCFLMLRVAMSRVLQLVSSAYVPIFRILIPFFALSALGYLYSSISLTLIGPENARAVLAAGCLLGGMNDLCAYSYEICRQSMSVETISNWVDFVATIPHTDGSPDIPGGPSHWADQ